MDEKINTQQTGRDLKGYLISLEIAALERWNKGDPDGFLALYAADFTYFDPMQERRLDGFDAIKMFYEQMRGEVKVSSYEILNPLVQLSGDTAVLTYNLLSIAEEKEWKWNCTEVYSRQSDDTWKIIHNHWSLTQSLGV